MFTKHYSQDLLAYCHGELDDETSRRVAEHLLECHRCRQEYDKVKSAVAMASKLEPKTAPAELWSEIDTLLDAQTADGKASTAQFKPTHNSRWLRLCLELSPVIIVVALLFTWYHYRSTKSSWIVDSVSGAPRIGSDSISKDHRLVFGQWLETDSRSSATLEIPEIGQVEVDPNSKMRVIKSKPTEQRMELDKGTIHATISAPPRLFFVNTPSAEAIDLGCKYTLNVDSNGAGLLTVELGWVSLNVKGRESIVPVGAMCATRPGVGPGTPYFHDAPQSLKDALSKFDFENGGMHSVNVVLSQARSRDAITLWHLLFRVSGQDRERVCDRLIELVPLPKGVTRDGVLSLNRTMLDRWRDDFEWGW
ncbi:MAG TPA: FecR domain-containing protein [Blastocatellia bacterium]|nr:FecR domain-containing protein [Blastocatellia bacterium]